MNVLSKLIDRLFYGGYEAASQISVGRVVARFARGNTSIQLGRYLNSARMERLLSNGDRAAARLAERAKRASI
jgi:hypothetical protein